MNERVKCKVPKWLPLVDKRQAASGNVARDTQKLASYHCRQSSKRILQRAQERKETRLRKFG